MTSHVNVLWPYTLPLQGFTPPMLVFVQSIERAKELFHELIYDGLNVDVIHSERTQAQRDNVVKCFRTGKVCVPAPPLQPQIEPYSEQLLNSLQSLIPVLPFQIWILICTDLMGRGIDFKGVNLVVNYDFPPSAISYIHRVGKSKPENYRACDHP